MTSFIFDGWIRYFDKKMKLQKRNVLLFVDYAPSHSDATLANVKLAFSSANTTSMFQPMDQGTIQAVMVQLRAKQL